GFHVHVGLGGGIFAHPEEYDPGRGSEIRNLVPQPLINRIGHLFSVKDTSHVRNLSARTKGVKTGGFQTPASALTRGHFWITDGIREKTDEPQAVLRATLSGIRGDP